MILILSCLSACGFKMYGTSSPLKSMPIYLQSQDPYGSFTIALKQALKSADIKLVENTFKAPITLNLTKITFYHDNPNITSSAQASIYNFTYTVSFDWKNNKTGKSLVGPQVITVTRALTLNPNEVLATSSEVKIMKGEMERELIMQIFNRLESNNFRKALQGA